MSEKMEGKTHKSFYICKMVGWLIMLFFISEFLIALNSETIITNWGIGLIGMVVFLILYIIDNDIGLVFKYNKFHAFMVSFFMAWLVADWDEFIQIVANNILTAYA